jgi:uncharacterized protein
MMGYLFGNYEREIMRVLITGGTGLIGGVLCRVLLADSHEVIVLSRSPQAKKDSVPHGVQLQVWDGDNSWAHLLHHDTAVINLVGGNIAALRWGDTRKQLVFESRIAAAQALVKAIENAPEKPHVLLQASDVGYYGDCENDIVIEDSPVGEGWHAETCREWEQVTAGLGVRQCILRIGLVLDRQSGALPLLMLGAGLYNEQQASRVQWLPWVHHLDVALALRFLMKHETAAGAFNIVASNPQTKCDFMKALNDTIKATPLPSTSESALHIALDETAAITPDSQRVIPYRLTHLGYKFRFPTLEDALRHLIG